MHRSKDVWGDIEPKRNVKKAKLGVIIVFIIAVVTVMIIIAVFYISPEYLTQINDDSETSGVSDTSEKTPSFMETIDNPVVNTPPEENFEYIDRESDLGKKADTTAKAAESNTNILTLPDGYKYGAPVPESEAVSDDYFTNAVFIGDSRTNGFAMHSGVKSNFWGHTGLNVSSIFSEKYIAQGEEKVDVITALTENPNVDKIYISLGINEIGWYSSNLFIQKYKEFVSLMKETLPNAIIYVQAIIPMAKSASDTTYASQGGNERLKLYNTLISEMCSETSAHYLDLFTFFADEEGYLPEEAGFDGVHLNPSYYKTWAEYLRTHTIG